MMGSTRTAAMTAIVAGLLLTGCGGGHPARSGSAPQPTTPPTTPVQTLTTTSTATQGGVPPIPGGEASGEPLPAGGPVPAGTEAVSATFVSPGTAYVLGTAPCQTHPCSAILRTTDRGARWVGLAAPKQTISYYLGSGLWGLRFADAHHGFAFGQGLWETVNGGQSWQRATPPDSTVLSLEAVQDHELVAVAQACRPGQGCARQIGLFHATIGGSWSQVTAAHTFSNGASISVHGSTVWVILGSRIYVSTDGASKFRSETQPCPAGGSNFGRPTSITDDGSHVYLLCTGQGFTGHTLKFVYATKGPGAAWSLVGRPPSPGDGGEISAGSDSSIVIASYSAASLLYRSTDGGRSWRTVLTEADGGAGWNDLGFTTASNAIVVHGPAVQDGAGDGRPGRLLLSGDGGRSWHAVSF